MSVCLFLAEMNPRCQNPVPSSFRSNLVMERGPNFPGKEDASWPARLCVRLGRGVIISFTANPSWVPSLIVKYSRGLFRKEVWEVNYCWIMRSMITVWGGRFCWAHQTVTDEDFQIHPLCQGRDLEKQLERAFYLCRLLCACVGPWLKIHAHIITHACVHAYMGQ